MEPVSRKTPKIFGVILKPEEYNALEKLAEDSSRSRGAVVRRLILQAVSNPQVKGCLGMVEPEVNHEQE